MLKKTVRPSCYERKSVPPRGHAPASPDMTQYRTVTRERRPSIAAQSGNGDPDRSWRNYRLRRGLPPPAARRAGGRPATSRRRRPCTVPGPEAEDWDRGYGSR
ncbi:hypothetical protein GCM10020218_010330 [Dactylosporangium vinaceum]